MRGDEHGIGPLFNRHFERGLVVGHVTDIDSMKSDIAGFGKGVCVRIGEVLRSIVRISRHHDQLGTWERLFEYLERFSEDFWKMERHTRDVPARPREVRYQTGGDRIPHETEYDRNSRGRLLGRHGSRRAHRDDHVNL